MAAGRRGGEFMSDHLDEKQRRLLAGGLARLLGRGAPTVVAEASGMSRNTVIDDAFEARKDRQQGGRAHLIDDTRPRKLHYSSCH